MINNTQCQKDFGKFIRDRRESLHLYQSDVASQLGITQSYYSYIEIGERNVDLVLALNICEILELNFSDFIRTYLPKKKIPRSR